MTTGRLPGLDILRAIAVLLVLGRHAALPPDDAEGMVKLLFWSWHRVGWAGVDLFFVLSGFLVSGLLFAEHAKHGTVSLRRFLARRAFRIYPPFYLLLGVSAVVYLATSTVDRQATTAFLVEALFIQNYVEGLFGHTWSLAVEEHFYLLLALGIVWSRVRFDVAPGALLRFGVFVVVAVTLTRTVAVYASPPVPSATFLFPTHLRIDALMIGVLVASLYHWHRARFLHTIRRWRWPFSGMATILLLPPVLCNVDHSQGLLSAGLLSVALGFAGVLALVIGMDESTAVKGRLAAALAGVGVHSYAIYLWHVPVRAMASIWSPETSSANLTFLLEAILYLSGSIALGMVMSRLVDRPVLAFRDRWLPSRSGERHPAHRRLPMPSAEQRSAWARARSSVSPYRVP